MTTKKVSQDWRTHYRVHPAAEVFPLMSEPELKELGASIRKSGQLQPILLWTNGGKDTDKPWLLDGRNRLEARRISGLDFFRADGEPYSGLAKTVFSGVDPAEEIIALNINRRHLTKDQKTRLALKARLAQEGFQNGSIPKRPGTTTKRRDDGSGQIKGSSKGIVGKVAEQLGVSQGRASAQLAVLKDPELNAKVESGELTPGQAERKLYPPKKASPVVQSRKTGSPAKKPSEASSAAAGKKSTVKAKVVIHPDIAGFCKDLRGLHAADLSKAEFKALDCIQEEIARIYDEIEEKS